MPESSFGGPCRHCRMPLNKSGPCPHLASDRLSSSCSFPVVTSVLVLTPLLHAVGLGTRGVTGVLPGWPGSKVCRNATVAVEGAARSSPLFLRATPTGPERAEGCLQMSRSTSLHSFTSGVETLPPQGVGISHPVVQLCTPASSAACQVVVSAGGLVWMRIDVKVVSTASVADILLYPLGSNSPFS